MKVRRTKVITVRDSDDVKSEEYHSDVERSILDHSNTLKLLMEICTTTFGTCIATLLLNKTT